MRTLAAVAALLISACGARAASPEELKAICEEAAKRYEEQFGSAQGAAPQPVVAMFKYTFCPRNLTVKRGTVVRFVNVDKRTTHSFWFRDAGQPESERFLPGEGATMTIDLPPGEHKYLCGPHWEREDMIGTITVTQ
ncbi:MAG: cupredoxin domain-containing protein [Bradyrhizobium sp.]|nr:cupredoxin domain-containing protein [Bradyrhizobium sp.]